MSPVTEQPHLYEKGQHTHHEDDDYTEEDEEHNQFEGKLLSLQITVVIGLIPIGKRYAYQ